MNKRYRVHKYFFLITILITLLAFLSGNTVVTAQTGSTTYYVDATGGNDDNNGTSPSSAWQSIFKVNNSEFNPGDSILFKRGEVWRERLVITSSGKPNNPIIFGAYGTGDKPLILGSVERNDASDWVNEGGNIWSTVDSKDGNELLGNPSFDEDTDGWIFSVGGSADASLYRDTEVYDSAPAGVRIDCVHNAQGDGQSWLYIYSGDLHILEDEWYVLSFKAKGSSQFDVCTINLLKSGSGHEYYSIKSRPVLGYFQISTEWKMLNVYFLADMTANDGQILLDFINLPNGESIYIDTLSFQKCDETPLYADVGNLIFNNEQSVGVRVDFAEDLDAQGEFWFDSDTGQLKTYSPNNPANYYSDIECALGSSIYKDIWDEESIIYIMADYITVEDLDLRYGGGDGIWCEEVSNVIIRGCDISYTGGTLIYSTEYIDFDFGPKTGFLRYGNGVTFWDETHNCGVEGCKIREVYDAAISNQGEEPNNNQTDIYYRNNLIWNSEYSFEIWDQPESANMNNIYVEDNVCIGAGFGWSHKQRPDPHGWHLALWGNKSTTDDIYIRNNVFYEAAFSALYYDTSMTEYHGLVLDNNYYYQKSGEMLAFKYDTKYTMEQFSRYQSEKGYDLNSITGDKEAVQEAARAMTRTEDITLLNGLFNTTNELEATKNEGVTLDGAIYADETEGQKGPPVGIIISIAAILLVIGTVAGVIIYRRKR